MRDPLRISVLGVAAGLLVAALTAGSGCAPDAVLGALRGTGGTAGTAGMGGKGGEGGATTTSTTGAGGSCTGPMTCATGLLGACSQGSRACVGGKPGPCVPDASPMPEDCVSTADLDCDGIVGCTGTVRWAQALSPKGLAEGTAANDASGVAFSKASDVFATGRLGGTTPIGMVSFAPPLGFLVALAGATGAVRYVDGFGMMGPGTSLASSGTAVAGDLTRDAVLLGGFYQGGLPFGLTSSGPSKFVAAVNPADGSVAATPADAGAPASQTLGGPVVPVVTVLPGPNDATVALDGNCVLTVGAAPGVALATSGTPTCYGLAYDAPRGLYYVVGSYTGSFTYANGDVAPQSSVLMMFVAQLDAVSASASINWHQEIGSPMGANEAMGVAVTQAGNVVVTGYYGGPFDLGLVSLGGSGIAGDAELFVLELAGSGVAVRGFGFGGMGAHVGRAVAVDPSTGDFVVVGDFAGTLAYGQGPTQALTTTFATSDIFVLRIVETTTLTLRWALQLGDAENQHGEAVAIDPLGDIAIAGQFDGNITYGSPQKTIGAPSGTGAYVMRLAP